MKIKNIKKIELAPTDVLVVNIDLGNLPSNKANALLESARVKMATVFPNNQVIEAGQNFSVSILSPLVTQTE
jgi:hypothetical protein